MQWPDFLLAVGKGGSNWEEFQFVNDSLLNIRIKWDLKENNATDILGHRS